MRVRCVGCEGQTISLPLLPYTEQFRRTCRTCGTAQLILAKPSPLHVAGELVGWAHTVTSHEQGRSHRQC